LKIQTSNPFFLLCSGLITIPTGKITFRTNQTFIHLLKHHFPDGTAGKYTGILYPWGSFRHLGFHPPVHRQTAAAGHAFLWKLPPFFHQDLAAGPIVPQDSSV